jgi:hypothetical protein
MSVSSEKTFRIPVELEEPVLSSEDVPLVSQLDKLTGKLLSTNVDGFYNYIDTIPSLNLFGYLIIIIVSILIFTKFNININHLVGLLIGIITVFFLNERDRTLNVDEMTRIQIKLERINVKNGGDTRYFYMDANIIELVYNLQEFHQYNPEDFDSMVHAIDNLLKLRLDIERGMEECSLIYDVAVDEKNKAMNHISAILISIPTSYVLKEKLITAIKILQLYLLRHLEFIKETCNEQVKKNGINVNTKLIDTMITKPNHDMTTDIFYKY